MKRYSLFFFILLLFFPLSAQVGNIDGLSSSLEILASVSSNQTPLWLNANRYGTTSLHGTHGYLRSATTYTHNTYGATLSAGLDLIAPLGYKDQTDYTTVTTKFILQQAYLSARYKHGELVIGSKQQPMELKNNELSSGSQTLGINARPIPQVRLGLADYWNIPGLNHWLSMKTHVAYGMQMDGDWQEKFTEGTIYKYNHNTLYHQKAGYLKIGKEERFSLTLTLGLEMASQFGGTVYMKERVAADDGSTHIVVTADKQYSGLSSFFNAFTGFGSEKREKGTAYQNAEGNHLGSWVFRLDWKQPSYQIGLYGDHFFEDHSSMFLLDYDGYGCGSEWDTRVKNRYFLYDLKDFLLGLEISLIPNDSKSNSQCSPLASIFNSFVIEYIDSRYQSGPIYHDHSQTVSDHIAGRDNYYNSHLYSGWNNYGQVIGNPLYLAPIYNSTGYVGTQCSRFYAWHFAFSGDPFNKLHYVLKTTYQKGYGTYHEPYTDPKESLSFLLEATYTFCPRLSFRTSFATDNGSLRGNSLGCQFSLTYQL